MTRIKLAKAHQKSYTFFPASMLLSFAVFAWVVSLTSDVRTHVVAGVIWFVSVAGLWIWRGAKLHKEFRCPDCDGEVGEPLPDDGQEGTPILRPCPRCDVLWHVGSTP